MEENKRFSLIYLERGEPKRDSVRLRKRLGAFYEDKLDHYRDEIVKEIHKELGVEVPLTLGGPNVPDLFEKAELRDILDSVTIIYTVLMESGHQLTASEWISFVRRAFREENLSYRVDNAGVVHYLVDEEFERNRISVLKSLEKKRYEGVRTALEDAYKHLDSDPMDTKAAVRSLFESIEILVRLMVPQTKNLNKWVVQNPLKEIAQKRYAQDEIASETINIIFDALGEWIHALHNYRHGQGKEKPVAPPLEFTVYVLSSGASFLRWLIELDAKE